MNAQTSDLVYTIDQDATSPDGTTPVRPRSVSRLPGMKSVTIGLGLALGMLTPLQANMLDEFEARQQAVVAAWEKGPLMQRRAVFVTAKPELYGAYEERKSNVFKPGEPLLTYVEPIGYTWKPVGNGEFQFGVVVDFVVKTKDGEILGGKEKLLTFVQKSRHKVQELMLNIALNVNGAPAGDYVVAYTIRDINGAKASTFEQPFKIAN